MAMMAACSGASPTSSMLSLPADGFPARLEVAAPSDKVRELIIWQLVSGYKLRELEVKDSLKDKFWGGDAKGIE